MLRRLPTTLAAGHGRSIGGAATPTSAAARGARGRGSGRRPGSVLKDIPPALPQREQKEQQHRRRRQQRLHPLGRGTSASFSKPLTSTRSPSPYSSSGRNPRSISPTPRRSQALIFEDPGVEPMRKISGRRKRQPKAPRPAPPTPICVSSRGISVRQLAAIANAKLDVVLDAAKSLDLGKSPDMRIEQDDVELVIDAANLNVVPEFVRPLWSGKPKNGTGRPVVAVMGHVDHGKTTLLDKLRGASVAQGEVGGITQSVAAFECDGITFIDTPGHAAFEDMRRRGAVATDVVVLVVAADDGVMPQTVEAVRHAKKSGVPIVVAVNKMDVPGADPDKVRSQLLQFAEINTEQIGGDVLCVEVSAKKSVGLKSLLEAVALQAELTDVQDVLKEGPGKMICIESNVTRDFGNVATVVVRGGKVAVGDAILFQDDYATSGELYGKVRAMVACNGDMVKEAGVGEAVGIVGVRKQIPPGALCMVMDEKFAKKRSRELIGQNERAVSTLQIAQKKIDDEIENEESVEGEEEMKKGLMNVVVKGAVQGSADAVANVLRSLTTKEFRIRVLETGTGDVTVNDVGLACATGKNKNNKDEAMIVAFGVKVNDAVRMEAIRGKLKLLEHNLIYKLEDEVREIVEMLKKKWETSESVLGKASVVKVFEEGKVAGCRVDDGIMKVGDAAKVWRFGKESGEREIVHESVVESLRKFAENAKHVEKGTECGISVQGWEEFEAGDVVEAVQVVKGEHAE